MINDHIFVFSNGLVDKTQNTLKNGTRIYKLRNMQITLICIRKHIFNVPTLLYFVAPHIIKS